MSTSASIHILKHPLQKLPDPLALPPPPPPQSAASTPLLARPPGSKSLTNRLLLLAALADGPSTLQRPLTGAEDAERMLRAITQLGAAVERAGDDLTIHGVAGRWRPATPQDANLDLHNAGTATRFLTAAALLSPTPVTIDGNARMRERPIAQLADALRALGARVAHLSNTDCPPIQVAPPQDLAQLAPSLELPTTASSQFVSALLLIAPWLPNGLTLRLRGPITSKPYIQMTTDLLARVGALVHTSENLDIIKVAPGADPEHPGARDRDPAALGLPAFNIPVEPDASGATYFWAAAALIPGRTVRVTGLAPSALQGDARFPELLQRMGADTATSEDDRESQTHPNAEPWTEVTGPERLKPIDADLADMPDTAMTLAACCAFADGPSTLRGLSTLRVKETDRIAALTTELRKLDLDVRPTDDDPDALRITPPTGGIDTSPQAPPVHFDTYDDHRMAMALALVALRRPNIHINDPACVAKTYPTYWSELAPLFHA